MRRIRSIGTVLTMAALMASLATPAGAATTDRGWTNSAADMSNQRNLCVGVRGNGPRLWAHFGALARLAEEYGPIHCAAGGSSGSITAFFIESIEINPELDACGANDVRCGRDERRAREALLYKSVTGLPDVGLGGDIQQLIELGQALVDADVLALLDSDDPLEGVDALTRVLADVVPLFNREILDLLAQSPDPVFHATDIVQSVLGALDFELDDPVPFVRPGIVNFDQLANILGRMASFYAGYGPFDGDGVDTWLDACALPSLGLSWEEAAALPASGGATCGDLFADVYNAYRIAFDTEQPVSRVDDPIGRYRPMLAVTGVLTGDAVAEWETARAQYDAAETVEFAPDFDDVEIGYWGRPGDLRRIERTLDRRYPGLQTDKFRPLGQSSWREVLRASPAEPGLSAGVPLATGEISVGGWADPLRVLVLDAMGGRHNVAINRLGGVGGFTTGVSALLGASPEELDALYSVEGPSDFRTGLEEADGMWCTDWDAPDTFDVAGLFADGYNAPLETTDRFFTRGPSPYENVTSSAGLVGCTPGVLPTPA